MRLYNLSVAGMVERFAIIMAIIVAAGFAGHYLGGAFWFIALLAFPVFMSVLLGITFTNKHISIPKPEFRHHRADLAHRHRIAH